MGLGSVRAVELLPLIRGKCAGSEFFGGPVTHALSGEWCVIQNGAQVVASTGLENYYWKGETRVLSEDSVGHESS